MRSTWSADFISRWNRTRGSVLLAQKTRAFFIFVLIFRLVEIILKKLQFFIAPFEGCCVIGEI